MSATMRAARCTNLPLSSTVPTFRSFRSTCIWGRRLLSPFSATRPTPSLHFQTPFPDSEMSATIRAAHCTNLPLRSTVPTFRSFRSTRIWGRRPLSPFSTTKPTPSLHFFTPFPDSKMSATIMAAHCTNLRLHSTSKPSLWRKPANRTVRMTQQTRVHRLIEDQGIVLMPGCYDALSAAIVQKAGFAAGFISGHALSASLLGKPDFGLLTPPEMAATARLVCAAAPLIPIIADADTGGGNALNVQRTVKDLIAAGAAGCFLEDQAWPKGCGHMRGKQVIPAEEHAAKIASARDAIGNSDFFLVARTDARATSAKTGLSDAIARANLYMEAGADACFAAAPRDDDELKEIGRRTKGYRACTMIEGGITPLHTPEELKAMGFHLILHPLTTLYASTRAIVDVLKSLKEKGTTRDDLDKMATFEEFNQLVSLESYFELEARYSNLRSAE